MRTPQGPRPTDKSIKALTETMAQLILAQVALPEELGKQRDGIQLAIAAIKEEIEELKNRPTRMQLVKEKIERKSAPVTTGVKKPRVRVSNDELFQFALDQRNLIAKTAKKCKKARDYMRRRAESSAEIKIDFFEGFLKSAQELERWDPIKIAQRRSAEEDMKSEESS